MHFWEPSNPRGFGGFTNPNRHDPPPGGKGGRSFDFPQGGLKNGPSPGPGPYGRGGHRSSSDPPKKWGFPIPPSFFGVKSWGGCEPRGVGGRPVWRRPGGPWGPSSSGFSGFGENFKTPGGGRGGKPFPRKKGEKKLFWFSFGGGGFSPNRKNPDPRIAIFLKYWVLVLRPLVKLRPQPL